MLSKWSSSKTYLRVVWFKNGIAMPPHKLLFCNMICSTQERWLLLLRLYQTICLLKSKCHHISICKLASTLLLHIPIHLCNNYRDPWSCPLFVPRFQDPKEHYLCSESRNQAWGCMTAGNAFRCCCVCLYMTGRARIKIWHYARKIRNTCDSKLENTWSTSAWLRIHGCWCIYRWYGTLLTIQMKSR